MESVDVVENQQPGSAPNPSITNHCGRRENRLNIFWDARLPEHGGEQKKHTYEVRKIV